MPAHILEGEDLVEPAAFMEERDMDQNESFDPVVVITIHVAPGVEDTRQIKIADGVTTIELMLKREGDMFEAHEPVVTNSKIA
jgi:hypothetical protein